MSDSSPIITEQQSFEEPSNGRWTREEHLNFIKGLELHGKGWKKIAALIKTRTVVQIRTHAQKYFLKLQKARNETNGKAQAENKSKDILKKVIFQSKEDAENSLYNFLTPNYPADIQIDRCDFLARGQTVDALLKEAERLDWAQDYTEMESKLKQDGRYQTITPKTHSTMDFQLVKTEYPFNPDPYDYITYSNNDTRGGFAELTDDALHSLLEMDACHRDDDHWPKPALPTFLAQSADCTEEDIELYFQD